MENFYTFAVNYCSKFLIIFYILLINKLIAAGYHNNIHSSNNNNNNKNYYNQQLDTHNVAKRMDIASCIGNHYYYYQFY